MTQLYDTTVCEWRIWNKTRDASGTFQPSSFLPERSVRMKINIPQLDGMRKFMCLNQVHVEAMGCGLTLP